MSNKRFEGDPIEQLRRADPLDLMEVPRDTTGAHARALFQEVISMETMEEKVAAKPRRWAKPVAFAASALAVTAMAVGAYAVFASEDAPEAIVGAPLGDAAQMCIQYEDTILLEQDVAFDGTLVSVEQIPGSGEIDFPQNMATFEVHRWYQGGEGDTVTLDAGILYGEGDSIALVGASLEIGERYLISGTDGFVWACGYSYTYDTEVANHWAELFGG